MHVFVDESKRGSAYLVCATVVPPRAVNQARRAVRALLRQGERRVHFVKEHPSRRREILAALTVIEARTRVYVCRGPAPAARRACLAQLIEDLAVMGASRLVIESREGRDQQDRHTIFTAMQAGTGPAGLVYEHMRPHEEPLLWPSDAVAWAYGAGGDWRRRVDPLLEKVTDLDRP